MFGRWHSILPRYIVRALVKCPKCGALPGRPCRRITKRTQMIERGPRKSLHVERYQEANAKMKDGTLVVAAHPQEKS